MLICLSLKADIVLICLSLKKWAHAQLRRRASTSSPRSNFSLAQPTVTNPRSFPKYQMQPPPLLSSPARAAPPFSSSVALRSLRSLTLDSNPPHPTPCDYGELLFFLGLGGSGPRSSGSGRWASLGQQLLHCRFRDGEEGARWWSHGEHLALASIHLDAAKGARWRCSNPRHCRSVQCRDGSLFQSRVLLAPSRRQQASVSV
jgi:hypothetical protein